MQPRRPGPKPRQHKTERLIAALKEHFKHDVDKVRESLVVDGRPLFHTTLTMEEELARYRDPETRQAILESIERRDGPAGVGRYISRISRLMGKQEQSDLARWRK